MPCPGLWEVKYPAHCSGYVNGSGYDVAEHFRSSNFAFPQVLPLGLELGLVLGLCLDFSLGLDLGSGLALESRTRSRP